MGVEIENVVIANIYRSDKNRDGEPYTSKKGQKFEKVDIHINPNALDEPEFEGKMSYFDYFNVTKNWAPGDSISGSVEKNGKYFNFSLPPKEGGSGGVKSQELDEIKGRVSKLEAKVFPDERVRDYSKEKPTSEEAVDFAKESEEDSDDLPF